MRLFLVTFLTVALLACSSEDGSDGKDPDVPTSGATDRATDLPRPSLVITAFGPTCDSLFVPGVIMVAEAADGCLDQPRGKVSPSTVAECSDGRVLIANPFGFGFVGAELYLNAPDGEQNAETGKLQKLASACSAS